MKINNYILSYDFLIALFSTMISYHFLPDLLRINFAISFYNIGITVLSIVFSLFFAVLAIVMASSDNDFIKFLEEEGDFTRLLFTFKFSLSLLFISLIYCIVLYMISDFHLKEIGETYKQCKWYFLVFQFFFAYSLFSSALNVKDTIIFSQKRGDFIRSRG